MEELFEAIAILPRPEVQHSLIAAVAPLLASAVQTPVCSETIHLLHLPGEAVQLANSLIRGRGGPLERELVAAVTAAVIVYLRSTDDMDVIQVGLLSVSKQ